jgi:ATP-dependent exoDNAse (exonuclease V) alpha subunit
MSIYRFSASIVKRSDGRSATAAAAYRAGMELADERTGLRFDYTRKRGVVHAEILAPADAPDWMRDRARLWNAVELVEKRKDAQLAREILLALPYELTHEQRLDLVRSFAAREFVARGMIADITMHAPDSRGDDRNWHAHVMLTMRELAGQGFGKKARDWNDTEQLEQWRAAWAAAVNHALEQHGAAGRVDHRSLAAQGINREPEPKQGPIATDIERQGMRSYAGDDRRATKERNARREQLAARLAETIAALEKDPAEVFPSPDPAQQISRPAWRRYLFELWQTVARGVTRPLARTVISPRGPRLGPIP